MVSGGSDGQDNGFKTTRFGKRPFRVHIDPAQDGAEIVNGVADGVRTEMYRRIGLENLLSPIRQRETT